MPTPAAESSEQLEVRCVGSSEFKLQLRDTDTVRKALEMAAEHVGLPNKSVEMLQMEFGGAVVTHERTLQEFRTESGVPIQEFRMLGEDEARAELKTQAEAVDIIKAAENGKLDDVQFVCTFAPDRVNSETSVRDCVPTLLPECVAG